MKVLLTLNAPTPYRIDFCNELAKLCDLTVTYERRYSSDRIKSWQETSGTNKFKEIFLNGIKMNSEMGFCPGIIKNLKQEDFDIIIIGGYSSPTGMLSILYLHSHKIKFILNADGGIKKNDSKIKYAIKRYFISKAPAYLSTSQLTDEYLIHYGADYEEIYRYPQTSLFKKDILKTQLTFDEKRKLRKQLNLVGNKIIISVGSFTHRKGFDILLKSISDVGEEISLYLIGGKATVEYMQIIKENDIKNVHFIDFLSKEMVFNYLKASDLFILPTRFDAWGMVINEAMACGLPVITTEKCVAGVELIENGVNGFIIPIENSVILNQKIIDSLYYLDLKKLSKHAIEKIENYSIENMAYVHKQIIDNLFLKWFNSK